MPEADIGQRSLGDFIGQGVPLLPEFIGLALRPEERRLTYAPGDAVIESLSDPRRRVCF